MERCLRLIIECTVTMSLVSILLLSITPLLAKRYSAKSLYAAWIVVLLGFVLPLRPQLSAPPIIVTLKPFESIQWQAPPRANSAASALPQAEMSIAAGVIAIAANDEPVEFASPLPFWRQLDTATLFIAAWAAGAIACFALRLFAHWRFLRTTKRWGRPVRNESAIACLRMLRGEMGIRRNVALIFCRPIDSPMLVGLLRPAILLPDEQLPPREMELVIRHELAHLRRGDLWGRGLLLLACAAHWFNPLFLFIARAVAFHCEGACDETVMKHTDYETRVYYSQTILKLINSRTGIATALSTRYYGGFDEMKKRITHILDRKAKRLGMMIVLIIAAASLGAGMAFALSPETAATHEPTATMPQGGAADYAGMPLEQQLAYDEQMADALTERLQTLITLYGEALPDESRLSGYAVRPSALVYMKTWDEVIALFDACADGASLAALLQSPAIYTTGAVGAEMLARHTDSILRAAGFADEMPHRSYAVSGNWHLGPGQETNPVPMWQVYAGGPSTPDSEDYQTVIMVMSGEGKLYSLVASEAALYSEATGHTSEAERQMARETAMAFVKAHALMTNAASDIAIVSSRTYQGETEPYTFVWVFDYAADDSYEEALPNYDEQTSANNVGFQIAVGLESGRILCQSPNYTVDSFIVNEQAEEDWALQMGKPYPFATNDYFVQMVIGPQIGRLVHTLRERYRESLSEEEYLLASHMAAIGDNPSAYLSANGDWSRLLDDLTACESAEAFASALRGDYLRINQCPPGEPTREDILAASAAALDAAGYSDLTLRSFMYSGWNSQGGYPGYEILASYPGATEREYPIAITVSSEGKLRLIDGPYPSYPDENSDDKRLTAEEQERYRALAHLIAAEHMDTGNALIEAEGIWVNEMPLTSGDADRFIQVQVPHTYSLDGDIGWYYYDLIFAKDSARLRSLVISGGDRDAYYEKMR